MHIVIFKSGCPSNRNLWYEISGILNLYRCLDITVFLEIDGSWEVYRCSAFLSNWEKFSETFLENFNFIDCISILLVCHSHPIEHRKWCHQYQNPKNCRQACNFVYSMYFERINSRHGRQKLKKQKQNDSEVSCKIEWNNFDEEEKKMESWLEFYF